MVLGRTQDAFTLRHLTTAKTEDFKFEKLYIHFSKIYKTLISAAFYSKKNDAVHCIITIMEKVIYKLL